MKNKIKLTDARFIIFCLLLILVLISTVYNTRIKTRFNYLREILFSSTNTEVACTMEAKMCPDGVTYVGRQGPKCEFSACPSATTTVLKNGDITLAVGEKEAFRDLNITFNTFIQDSRCPIDVQCIQAGAVNINVTLSDKTQTITKNFPSDEIPETFGMYKISIVDVMPRRMSKQEINPKDYIVTFHVEAQ